MAGIGFELKKLFRKKGVFSVFRAYGYASVICAGPMLLGVLLLVGIMYLCNATGASLHSRELIICMITYTLLASLMVTSFFSMVVTRFLADMIYEKREEYIIPSFWGSTGIMLVIGVILYGCFLAISGICAWYQLLCLGLFAELIVVWNAMSYLTAIKDYRGIILSFFVAVVVTFLSGYLMLLAGLSHETALMLAVFLGYGVMLIWDVVLLYSYFPQGERGAFFFLQWMDHFKELAFTGMLIHVGLFSHLVIMWIGPIGVQVEGLFYGAPYHDVPALLAFITTLVTTVNFVVSVEVNFYPKYRTYYSLFNHKGTIIDIRQAEEEMLEVLNRELKYTGLKQLFASVLALSLGSILLTFLPLGFNDLMQGYFRTLCVGYGLYAVGNTILLILLYFTDYFGALWAALLFAVTSVLGTTISLFYPKPYYGFGFLVSAGVFLLAALLRLNSYTKRLPYYILSTQSIVSEDKSGMFSKFGAYLEKKIGEDQTIE